RNASTDIQDGANTLDDGMQTANTGMQSLEDNVPTLIAGTDELYNGLTTFHNELPKEIAHKLETTVLENKDPLHDKINETTMEKKAEVSPIISARLAEEIASGAANTIVTEANDLIDDAPERI